MRARTTTRRRRRGNNAIEFALISVPLIALVTGIMDYSWIFATQHIARMAANDAARQASMTAQTDDPTGQAEALFQQVWTEYGVGIDATATATLEGDPQHVVLTVTIDTPGIVGLLPTPETLQVSSVRRMEQQPEDEGLDTGLAGI